MDKKTINLLLCIASVCLSVAGLILLVVQIFGDSKNNYILCMAFGSIILANLFNLIRTQINKNNKE